MNRLGSRPLKAMPVINGYFSYNIIMNREKSGKEDDK
jgi:hypothetical protein